MVRVTLENAAAMTTLAANPCRLGAKIGGLTVLHTWGQALTHHPHLHCVVPGGGIAPDGSRRIAGHPGFFLPVKPLSQLFRRLFRQELRKAFCAGGLGFYGDLTPLAEPDTFAAPLAAMRRIDRVVYAKKPFGGPAQVLAYPGRYTHRVAIANSRLVALDHTHVAFNWKDYRSAGATRVMRLKADEFIRRFLLHTLPDSFHRIRSFGFMANRHRATRLALCRELIRDSHQDKVASDPSSEPAAAIPACPHCGGVMRVIGYMSHSFHRPSPRAPPFRSAAS